MEDSIQDQKIPNVDDNGSKEPDKQGAGEEANSGNILGSAAMRPIFLGNLKPNFTAEDILKIFDSPNATIGADQGSFQPIPVDRLDQKRGYCFVFLKDAVKASDKDNAERFVAAISGMEIKNVSSTVRAEFARGDGRIKRKEDDRRKNIMPSDTLFVVNFSEDTTKREDLKMLFEPYGELVRIDMKRNYAFVQFRNIDEATKAKEATHGGRLEQSVLTVEYVARQRNHNDGNGGRRGGNRYREDRRGGSRYRDDRYRDDRRGNGGYRGDRGGADYRGDRGSDRDHYDGRGGDRINDDRGRGRDDFRGGGRDRNDSRGPIRDRSPERGGHRGSSPGRSPGRGDYRRRSRSRSRSLPRFRDDDKVSERSPPRRYDERGRNEDHGNRFEENARGRSPDNYRGRDDRGYRS